MYICRKLSTLRSQYVTMLAPKGGKGERGSAAPN